MEVADLRCEGCGQRDLLAIAPGEEPLETDQFLILRGTPVHAWCQACWLRRNGITPGGGGLRPAPAGRNRAAR